MRDYLRALTLVVGASLQAGPLASAVVLLLTIAQTVAGPLFAVAAGYLIDAATAHDQEGTVAAALVLAACVGARWVLGGVATHITVRLQRQVAYLLDCRLVIGDSQLAGLEHHERADYLAQFDLLRTSYWQVGFALSSVVQTIALLVQWVATALILLHLFPLLLILPLCALPSLLMSARVQQALQTANQRVVEHVRREAHLFDLGTSASAAKEVRVCGLGDTLAQRRRVEADTIVQARHQARRSGAFGTVLGQVIFTAGYIGAIALVAVRVLDKTASAGDIVVVAGLASQVRGLVGESAATVTNVLAILQVVERILWMERYAASRSLVPPRSAERPAGMTGDERRPAEVAPTHLEWGIDLEGVSFHYPGTAHRVLDGVTLHLPAGATVALVGDNGAGKSTLVKLLCRFYEPTAGRITVDGVDLQDSSVAAWRSCLAGAFQDYARFELIVRETVGVGDVAALDPRNDDVIDAALRRAGAQDVLVALPQGLDTMLGNRWPGGVELSGGQWQKLALGRARMRDHPLLLVLDEPTAALDSASEHALFERFAGAAREVRENGGITLLISHRFSTVRMADLIVVIAGGRVQEVGSHDRLMAHHGLYAELYTLQANAYASPPSQGL